MPEFIRTFVAIPVEPTRVLKRMLLELRELGGPIRVVDEEELHLTLSFLGDTPLNQTPQIIQLIQEIASQHEAIDLTVSGLDAFPSPQRPRVVWAGLTPLEPLRFLAGELSEQISSLGFPREDRQYNPHLTLARVKGRPPKELFKLMENHVDLQFGELHADRVNFYQSELTSNGPRYTTLSEIELPV